MWSVVERTALAEAEVEYQDYESDTVWVKFPVVEISEPPTGDLRATDNWFEFRNLVQGASVVIWTTTPWTMPGNRAISYSPRVSYGLYEVTAAENEFGPQPGEKLVFADALAEESFVKAKLEFTKLRAVSADELAAITCAHPLKGLGGGYSFPVPLLPGDHVTDDAGTGFVHTAPGHGREDFDVWMEQAPDLRARGIDTSIPFTVDDAGYFTKDAPGFGPDRDGGPARVIDDNGKKGDANKAGHRGADRCKPCCLRAAGSSTPIRIAGAPRSRLFSVTRRNGSSTWNKDLGDATKRCASRALAAIDSTRFVPASGQTRLRGMIEERPDWVLSRQRAWGVPICVFADDYGEVLKDEAVNARILAAFEAEGADAWFAEGARERFLGSRANEPWEDGHRHPRCVVRFRLNPCLHA